MANKITTNLWFDDQAQEAAEFYTSILKTQESTTLLVTAKQALSYTAALKEVL